MKIKTKINPSKRFFYENKNNIKLVDNYYSRKNEPMVQMSLENKNKKKKIKPPFKQGLYSYKQSFNTLQNDYNQNMLNNHFYSNSPNKHKKENNILNINSIIQPIDQHISNNNSSLSFSSINLNKYKINTIPSQKNKNIIFNNNIYNSNNINNIKNTNTNLNLSNYNNKVNKNNNNYNKKIYQDYFIDNQKYEKESRRMIVELIKILNRQNNNNINNNNNNIKQFLIDNNISLKVLNQKYNEREINYNNLNNSINDNNNNQELFGEAKKQLYLKNLNYSLSYDSVRSNYNDEASFNDANNVNNASNKTNNNILSVNNLNSLLLNKEKKKINILNFLCVPRILNLIEEEHIERCIFLITLDEIYFKEGKESYFLQWRDMDNNEIKNEFNLKEVKSCKTNKKNKNRFIIEMEKNDLIESLNYEIEAPSEEICNNYVIGINYLI